MDDRRQAWNDAIPLVVDKYDADLYGYSGPIDDNGFGQITKAVATHLLQFQFLRLPRCGLHESS